MWLNLCPCVHVCMVRSRGTIYVLCVSKCSRWPRQSFISTGANFCRWQLLIKTSMWPVLEISWEKLAFFLYSGSLRCQVMALCLESFSKHRCIFWISFWRKHGVIAFSRPRVHFRSFRIWCDRTACLPCFWTPACFLFNLLDRFLSRSENVLVPSRYRSRTRYTCRRSFTTSTWATWMRCGLAMSKPWSSTDFGWRFVSSTLCELEDCFAWNYESITRGFNWYVRGIFLFEISACFWISPSKYFAFA